MGARATMLFAKAKETQIIEGAKSREVARIPLSGEEKCYVDFAILQA